VTDNWLEITGKQTPLGWDINVMKKEEKKDEKAY
jgi:hypothetical protein